MEHIINTAIELGLTPLNLVLIVMLYFMGAQNGTFPKFWNKEEIEENRPPTLHDVHNLMSQLKGHYNDETTDKLITIARNQEDMKRGIDKISTKQDSIADDIKGVRIRQDSWHEYGIKIRKEV